jgi:hypothetical protein
MSINLDSWQFGSHQEQCMRRASECIRLAGLTDDVGVRDQLVKLAEGLGYRQRTKIGPARK